jgi:hypothetical protein
MNFNVDNKIGEIVYIDPNTIDTSISQTQIPDRYNPNVANEYAEAMTLGKWDFNRQASFPQLFISDGIYFVGDGHHTIDAAQTANIESIGCFVAPGGVLEAKIYSFRHANRYNGLSLTNQQKQNIVLATLSDRAILGKISESCGGTLEDIPSARAISSYLNEEISTITIGKLITSAIADGSCPWLDIEKAIGMDGRHQPTKKKKAKQVEPKEANAPELTSNPAPGSEDLLDEDSEEQNFDLDRNSPTPTKSHKKAATSVDRDDDPIDSDSESLDRIPKLLSIDALPKLSTVDEITSTIMRQINWSRFKTPPNDLEKQLANLLKSMLVSIA